MQIIMDIGIIDLKTLGITDMAFPDLNTQSAMAIGIAGPGISRSFFLIVRRSRAWMERRYCLLYVEMLTRNSFEVMF